MTLTSGKSPPSDTTAPEIEALLDKVKTVVRGPNGELLVRLVDILFHQEMASSEYFSPADLADIQAGVEEIRRGDTVSWEDFKRENNL